MVAPILLAAGTYVLLGRLSRAVLPAGRQRILCGLSARWTTAVFVVLDILSAGVQSSGSAVASGDDWVGPAAQTGINILTAGLAVQLVTIVGFIGVFARFHRLANRHARPDAPASWRKLMMAVYIASALITVGPCLSPGLACLPRVEAACGGGPTNELTRGFPPDPLQLPRWRVHAGRRGLRLYARVVVLAVRGPADAGRHRSLLGLLPQQAPRTRRRGKEVGEHRGRLCLERARGRAASLGIGRMPGVGRAREGVEALSGHRIVEDLHFRIRRVS